MSSGNFRVVQGDMMQDKSYILVCPVNCVPGVMCKGLAKVFAATHKGLKRDHEFAIKTGGMGLRASRLAYDMFPERCWGHDVLMFPTKRHWKDPSEYEWIWSGLGNFSRLLHEHDIGDGHEVTIAMPALGCGLGELDFDVVGPMIEVWAKTIHPRFTITLYRPHEAN